MPDRAGRGALASLAAGTILAAAPMLFAPKLLIVLGLVWLLVVLPSLGIVAVWKMRRDSRDE